MDRLNEVLKRLKRQFNAYAQERDDSDEDVIIDISVACNLADSVPYLIDVIEKQQKEIEKLNGLLDAKIVFINNGWEEERYVLQEENEQLESDINSLKDTIVHKYKPRIEELELFINDFLELHREQKKLSKQAEELL